jgi:hypothetical protein
MIQRPKNNSRNGDTGFLHPTKFNTQKSKCKVVASVFWDKDGIRLVDYLKNGIVTIKAKHCVSSYWSPNVETRF